MNRQEQFNIMLEKLRMLEEANKEHTAKLIKFNQQLDEIGVIMMLEDVFKDIDNENV